MDLCAIVLAAGKGKRMKSEIPKVLHLLLGKPLLCWVLENVAKVSQQVLVVVGYKKDAVVNKLQERNWDVEFVYQDVLDGTGGAVKRAISKCSSDWVLICCGDMPLISSDTLKSLISEAKDCGVGAVLVAKAKDKSSYGRVWVDSNMNAKEIIEASDLDSDDAMFVNSGCYVFRRDLLEKVLNEVSNENKQGEYYLTDAISIFYKGNRPIKAVEVDFSEIIGINNRVDLSYAEDYMKRKILEQHMLNGVTVCMPSCVYIEADVEIGRDTVIYPFTVIESGTKIGKNCKVGPFARIRGGSVIEDNCCVGNFVEVNRSKLSSNVRAKHLTYLGDTVVGENVNVGAGVITANYDGKDKHTTVIEENVFLGSGAILIAPVKIGRNAIVGAGAVVTRGKDVLGGSVVVGVPARELKNG